MFQAPVLGSGDRTVDETGREQVPCRDTGPKGKHQSCFLCIIGTGNPKRCRQAPGSREQGQSCLIQQPEWAEGTFSRGESEDWTASGTTQPASAV